MSVNNDAIICCTLSRRSLLIGLAVDLFLCAIFIVGIVLFGKYNNETDYSETLCKITYCDLINTTLCYDPCINETKRHKCEYCSFYNFSFYLNLGYPHYAILRFPTSQSICANHTSVLGDRVECFYLSSNAENTLTLYPVAKNMAIYGLFLASIILGLCCPFIAIFFGLQLYLRRRQPEYETL